MHYVSADIKRNTLVIALWHKESPEERNVVFKVIKNETDKLKPGFICVTCFLEFIINVEDAKWLMETREYLISKGVSRFMQISDDKDSVSLQNKACPVEQVPDIIEAINRLEERGYKIN